MIVLGALARRDSVCHRLDALGVEWEEIAQIEAVPRRLSREQGLQRLKRLARFMRVYLQNGAQQECLLQSLAPQSAAVDLPVHGLGHGVELVALLIAFFNGCCAGLRLVPSLLQGLDVVPGL